MPKYTKVKDKWRAKRWYTVKTPPYFGDMEVASIPAEDPNKLIGRVVDTTLYDITGDFSHQPIRLRFLITEFRDGKALTILKGHEYAADYLRSLVRRGTSRIDGIFTVTTKDGYVTRVSIVAFTRHRIKASQEHAIREAMRRVIEEKAKELSYEQLCQEMVLGPTPTLGGKIGSDVYNLAKKITPLRHVGVRKSKLLAIPVAPRKVEEAVEAAEGIGVQEEGEEALNIEELQKGG
ncbi:MAG: 30S ribosomal protein S3ae [Candidatus Bathyarchaeia archaeon]